MIRKIYTIGYTQKSAEEFFGLLKVYNIRQVVDVRENNTSQLSGFTKRNDLAFFLKEILNAQYIYLPEFAPDKKMRGSYKKNKDWTEYEKRFLSLICERNIIQRFRDSNIFVFPFVLLCSEPSAERCHRRLVADFLQKQFYQDAEIIHL